MTSLCFIPLSKMTLFASVIPESASLGKTTAWLQRISSSLPSCSGRQPHFVLRDIASQIIINIPSPNNCTDPHFVCTVSVHNVCVSGLCKNRFACGWGQLWVIAGECGVWIHVLVCECCFSKAIIFFITAGYSLLCVWMDAHHKGNIGMQIGFFSSHLSPALKKRDCSSISSCSKAQSHATFHWKSMPLHFHLSFLEKPHLLIGSAPLSSTRCIMCSPVWCCIQWRGSYKKHVVICLTCFEAYSAY